MSLRDGARKREQFKKSGNERVRESLRDEGHGVGSCKRKARSASGRREETTTSLRNVRNGKVNNK